MLHCRGVQRKFLPVSVSSLLPFVKLFFAGGGASETKTRRAFLVLVSERLRWLRSCSSLSTCREPRYEAPVACFDHRSCPYHSAPLIKLPEYVLKHHAPRTSHCGCTISILEDVENVRVGWSGGPGEPYPFVFWPVTEVWALGIGHYKCWSHNTPTTPTPTTTPLFPILPTSAALTTRTSTLYGTVFCS